MKSCLFLLACFIAGLTLPSCNNSEATNASAETQNQASQGGAPIVTGPLKCTGDCVTIPAEYSEYFVKDDDPAPEIDLWGTFVSDTRHHVQSTHNIREFYIDGKDIVKLLCAQKEATGILIRLGTDQLVPFVPDTTLDLSKSKTEALGKPRIVLPYVTAAKFNTANNRFDAIGETGYAKWGCPSETCRP